LQYSKLAAKVEPDFGEILNFDQYIIAKSGNFEKKQ
jgi:hypothetical protein